MVFKSRRSQEPIRNPKKDVDEQSFAFRRSRTLTGSASSVVVSASEPHSQLKSPRLKEHELRKHRKLLVGGLLSTLVLSGACLWLLDQYALNIRAISSSNQPVASQYNDAQYRDSIKEYFMNRPLERFRFALKTDTLIKYMVARHPEIASIALRGEKGLLTAGGVLEFRKPVVVWQVGPTKYYVDQNGETFQISVFGEPNVAVKDESGINVQSSQLVASSRLLRFLGQTVGGVNKSGVGTVSQVTIPSGTLRQLDLKLDRYPYRLKTHMDREPAGQVADIVATLQYLDSKKITPEYVDLRVRGKAYYR